MAREKQGGLSTGEGLGVPGSGSMTVSPGEVHEGG